MNDISKNRRFFLCLIYSFLAIVVSLHAEFSWKIQPCLLCKLARVFFIVLAICSFLGFFALEKTLFWHSLQALLLCGFCLSLYHTLLIMEFWTPAACSVAPNAENGSDYFAALESRNTCSKQGLWLFGIPGPLWNVGFCGISMLLTKQKKALLNEQRRRVS